MGGLPDPDWYLDHVLVHAEPGRAGLALGPAAAWSTWWAEQARGDEPILALARRQGFVVSTAQLRAAGLADHDVRREVRRGRWWIPGRGAAAPLVVPGDDHVAQRRRHALRATAAALGRPGHLISGTSAAILYGLPTMAVPHVPELRSPVDDWLGRRGRTHLRHSAVARPDRAAWYGAPVIHVARTIVDLGRHDRRTAIMAADAALRERLTTRAELAAALSRAAGWPGVRQAREIVALADGDAESPLESIVRLALHDDGFPPPKLQRWVGGFRVDLLWPKYRLILEADGRTKYVGDEGWEEKKRQLALDRLGWDVERVVWAEVVHEWAATRARLWPYFR